MKKKYYTKQKRYIVDVDKVIEDFGNVNNFEIKNNLTRSSVRTAIGRNISENNQIFKNPVTRQYLILKGEINEERKWCN